MMKKLIFTISIILFCTCFSKAQRVFVADSTVEDAISVFVTTDSTLADLYVYQVSNENKAKKDGYWYMVSSSERADMLIWYAADYLAAELIVYYVNNIKKARWKKPVKRVVYNKRKHK